MPRNRILRPSFAQSPVTGRLTREARLFFILLWPVADDAGRLRLDWPMLQEHLFPFDDDAWMMMPQWLDELVRESCLERYHVAGLDYLRIVAWKRLQTIDRPSRSHLPPPPRPAGDVASGSLSDWAADMGDAAADGLADGPAREPRESRESREDSPERPIPRASEADPREPRFFSKHADGGGGGTMEPCPITPDRVLADLDRMMRKAERDDSHTSAARYIELMGRHTGLWGRVPAARKKEGRSGPTIAELHGRNPDGTKIGETR